MKIEQMLETEAHFRLGSVSNLNPTPDDVMAERGRRHGISLFGFDTAEYRPLDINGWSKRLEQNPDSGSWDIPKDASGPLLRHRRNIELVADVQPFGDIGVFYADMRDAVTVHVEIVEMNGDGSGIADTNRCHRCGCRSDQVFHVVPLKTCPISK